MNTGTPPAKAFGHLLQRDGLAGAGGAGDQAVAVGQAGQHVTVDIVLGNQEGGSAIGFLVG
jgi:hypothetical protein